MCLKTIGPKVMTWRQYGEAATHMFNKKVLGHKGTGRYVPDFTEGVQHFALHAGGYAVVKGLQKAMRLPVERVLPSFATLRDYGNTSCSTTWCVSCSGCAKHNGWCVHSSWCAHSQAW